MPVKRKREAPSYTPLTSDRLPPSIRDLKHDPPHTSEQSDLKSLEAAYDQCKLELECVRKYHAGQSGSDIRKQHAEIIAPLEEARGKAKAAVDAVYRKRAGFVSLTTAQLEDVLDNGGACKVKVWCTRNRRTHDGVLRCKAYERLKRYGNYEFMVYYTDADLNPEIGRYYTSDNIALA